MNRTWYLVIPGRPQVEVMQARTRSAVQAWASKYYQCPLFDIRAYTTMESAKIRLDALFATSEGQVLEEISTLASSRRALRKQTILMLTWNSILVSTATALVCWFAWGPK